MKHITLETRLADWIARQHHAAGVRIIGINGAQGSGKSTLARRLTQRLDSDHGLRAVTLALDDLYLGHTRRQQLATEIHPLLATRGVPGTHDVPLGSDLLERLPRLGAGELLHLPRFLKSMDDRAPETDWPAITGPVDLLLFEGWCIGTPPQTCAALQAPVNALEAEQDADGRWRRWVNDQLAGPYQRLFSPLQRLIFLQAPSFDCVLRWRLQQERTDNAREASGSGCRLMDEAALRHFIAHYERLTRHAMQALPQGADVCIALDAGREALTLAFADARQCGQTR